VGTPEEVYFRPDNVFVAGFIGSPSMNFFLGRIVGTPGEMEIEFAGTRLRLPAERARRLSTHIGEEVTCGIRPEDIHDRAFIRAEVRGQPIEGLIDVTEMMGNERFLYVVVGGERLLARVDSRTAARAGQHVQLLLDVDRLHIFTAASGTALDKIDLPEAADGGVAPSITAE
jgi:multiple sugar transport system ATP-binding protein